VCSIVVTTVERGGAVHGEYVTPSPAFSESERLKRADRHALSVDGARLQMA
jgi:hypothetical protein